jgi:hypothetical protein
MSDNNDGFWSGLLGPSDDELAALRKKYAIPEAEPPSAMASMGRGVMDIWEPLRQMYLNRYHPAQATAYRAQRQEDERLYQRGLLSGNPRPPDSWQDPDLWRQAGRGMVAAPLLLPGLMSLPATGPEAAMSLMLSGGVYDALDAARKRLGLLGQ